VRAAVGDLVGVTTPRSFLGKSYGRELLAIEWRTPTGTTDKLAVYASNLDAWLAALAEAGVAVTARDGDARG
jgi:hypothetical protein